MSPPYEYLVAANINSFTQAAKLYHGKEKSIHDPCLGSGILRKLYEQLMTWFWIWQALRRC